MPWFKLEDSFHTHPKVKRSGNAAIGLWVRCGTYSSQYLTDGHIPIEVARDFGRRSDIDRLLDTSMWVTNGDSELVIPDYLDFNPSREQVLAERAAARERQARKRRNQNGEFA